VAFVVTTWWGVLEIGKAGDGLRTWRVAENILNKQLRTTGDGIQAWGGGEAGWKPTALYNKESVYAKCYIVPPTCWVLLNTIINPPDSI
jgi:hypothetical protein